MRYYHTTNAADAILSKGFRDNPGSYGRRGATLRGVIMSDQPLDGNEGMSGEEVLEVDLPDLLHMDDYQLVQDGRHYRQWCLPASLLNGFPRRLLSKEQVAAVRDGSL